MATFAELRERLSLDGKQFERVCKWFLETDPRYSDRLVNVWLWDDWPGCWGPDTGIDLVAEDRDGKNWAIQAKCYDPKYSVTKNDVDKFLSESTNENIHHRLLIATTDHLGKNARGVIHRGDKVIPISQLLLQDLEAAPVIWPANPDRPKGGGPRKPVKRWPHQTQAINNVTRNLGKRGQMISACGTGKTLAALWISERLEAKRTLVLVPSLTLLSQTVSEWLTNTKEPFAYLPVCSDDTVSRGNDAAVMFTSDLEYPVTTNPDDIATFLRKRGRQVVFSTYQSSPQITEAQTHNRVPGFDLVIADEAHRCAGKVSSAYGTVLDDEAIRAKKRLFMTATPRTYTARVQKKAREAEIEVASMDDEAVFGPVVHQLNFGEAIEKGLLSDYQVVVVGVDNSRYKEMVDKRRIVKADKGLQTDAETLAKHVALAKAIRDYGLRRTITFHSRINTASEFANMLPKVVSWMPPRHQPKVELVTDHVSGEMTTGERNRRLNRLRNVEPGQSAVLTNAQCLSEGIDVPTLDGVAFIDPRRSQVDIIQAVGRAIRLSEDKTIGTIVIPVFLSDTDDPDTALSQSEFEPVWSIVRALRSHDDALGEALDRIRFEMGRKGGGGSSPEPIVLDLPTGVSRKFAGAFATRLVERTTSSWNFRFGQLEDFALEHGHPWPTEHLEGPRKGLGNWVMSQRAFFREGLLEPGLAARLEGVDGWAWDPRSERWERNFRCLMEIAEHEGHTLFPARYEHEGLRVGSWVHVQRQAKKKGSLTEDQERRLETVPNWVWDPTEEAWRRAVEVLMRFVEREGHADVPTNHVEDGYKLGPWAHRARQAKKNGDLSSDRVNLLESLPLWRWSSTEVWQRHCAALLSFAQHHGDCKVPKGYQSEGIDLATWLENQRAGFRRGTLSSDRVASLELIPGWAWEPHEASFEEGFAALQAFVAREGHASPVVSQFEGEFPIGQWVFSQRQRLKNGWLAGSQQDRLETLPGWVWDHVREAWEAGLRSLLSYLDEHGSARVPVKYHHDGFPLGSWANTQRKRYRTNRLPKEDADRLDALPGWVWSVR